MSAFSLKRMKTTSSRVHEMHRSSRRKRVLLGGSPISDWSTEKASRLGKVALGMAGSVWLVLGLAFTKVFPSIYFSVGIGAFIITHLVLLVGEMSIQREIPERKKILVTLWSPIFILGGLGFMMMILGQL